MTFRWSSNKFAILFRIRRCKDITYQGVAGVSISGSCDKLGDLRNYRPMHVTTSQDEEEHWEYVLTSNSLVKSLEFRFLVHVYDGTNYPDVSRIFVIPQRKLDLIEKCFDADKILVEISSSLGCSKSHIRVFTPEHYSQPPAAIFNCVDTSVLLNIKNQILLLRKENESLKRDVISMAKSTHMFADASNEISEIQSKLQIRKLISEINELKGKVTVVARIRPLLTGEDSRIHYDCSSDPSSPFVSIHDYSDVYNPVREFHLDNIFGELVNNEELFKLTRIKTLVESSVIFQNNLCIFSYGQTCSGKTHTMVGTDKDPGIIPMAVDVIFSTITSDASLNRAVDIEMVEIYRESVFKLIERTSINLRTEAMDLYKTAIKSRATASTNLNDTSSRSHCACIITLRDIDRQHESKIFLVDLAGSERTKISGAEGDRLAEANAINKSLSTLGLILNGLLNKHKFIPYRDSKLTRLLAPVFTRSTPPSKILMIANVSPNLSDLKETVSTLSFAQRVCNIEMRDHIGEDGSKLQSKIAQMEDQLRIPHKRRGISRSRSFCV
jgi:hypothetical protein